jgi:cytochrome c-type biogenesis protein CcmE
MLKTIKAALLATLLCSGAALAHEGHDHGKGQHVMGTVESVAADQLKVKSKEGKTVDVHVDDKTKYVNGDAEGKLDDLKTGAKVVVHGEPMKNGTLHATEVRFGKPSKTAPGEMHKEGADHASHDK